LATAWLLAPKHGKHPYLWFASVPVVLSVGIERLRLAGVEYGIMSTPTSTSNEVEVNGEVSLFPYPERKGAALIAVMLGGPEGG
jgi:hypothetical protein